MEWRALLSSKHSSCGPFSLLMVYSTRANALQDAFGNWARRAAICMVVISILDYTIKQSEQLFRRRVGKS
jgi:hypothetical protein